MIRIKCIRFVDDDAFVERINELKVYVKEVVGKGNYKWDWSDDEYGIIEIGNPEIATAFKLKFGL